MRFQRLSEWLSWQETLHAKEIDLGLARCGSVATRLGLDGVTFPIVAVAGTNGKGSCVAMLESILTAQGYRVGAYTSPHLVRYNERVRVQGEEASDEVLMSAFDSIDRARGTTSLTYFEFGTLAAMEIFRRNQVQAALLEVGLGGRLDAVNLFDADVALVTTVGIDHVNWLGQDREAIGREKAGIFRAHRPAVCGDPNPPASVKAHAQRLETRLFCLGEDYHYAAESDGWQWTSGSTALTGLPKVELPGEFQYQNAAASLMVVRLLDGGGLRVGLPAIRQGLHTVQLRGRFEVLGGPVERILDVAHNVQAATSLASTLKQHPCAGRSLAVVAMMADKDIDGVLNAMDDVIDAWYVAGLRVVRGAAPEVIVEAISALGDGKPISGHSTVTQAYVAALENATSKDRVVVFGSFYAVGEIMGFEEAQATGPELH